MSTRKYIQILKKEYEAGFHKFSTVGDGSCNIPLRQLVTSNVVDVLSIRGSNVGIGIMNPNVSLDTNRTDSYKLPAGSTEQRPVGVQGYIRYNTDTNQFEGYGAGNTWGSLGGVKSTDQYTYITAELTPANNDSNLRFYTSDQQQAIINQVGNLGIGTTLPTQKLHVEGSTYISQTLTASNLVIFGSSTILNTLTSNTEQIVITNDGTGPALKVTQTGNNSVAEFYDNETGIALFIGNNGNVGIGSTQPQVSLVINKTDSLLLPKGSTVQRPSGVQGYIRYNIDTNQFEGFGAGNSWGSLGGVKSTDQYTYITAELTPGNNDSNLRFYTSAQQQAIINPYGNLGIGTANPTEKVHVEGNVYISNKLTASNIISNSATINTILNSNLTVYGELNFGPNSSTLKTNLQVNPVRKTIYINTDTSNIFYIQTPGIYTAYSSNVQVFLNQELLLDVNELVKEYTVNSIYTSSPAITTFTITLTTPAILGDILDITIWPQLIQESATNPGYVYQQVRVSETHFTEINNNLAFINGNIGIGTTNVSSGRLVVAGNIVPSSCNVYDLGTPNLRFRDLYLSGNTIDLGGTKLSREEQTGGLSVLSSTGQPSDIRTKSVYISNTLEFTNNSFIVKADGNVGIGTTNPRQKLEVNGHIIPSSCNLYDLGTPNLRFRDLYLSGNTINMEGNTLTTSASDLFINNVQYIPPGTIIYVAASTAPTGFLKANGSAISRSVYNQLFSRISTTFGAGDGSTTFTLPDLRGEFVRGWDDSRGADSGRAFGNFQDYEWKGLWLTNTGQNSSSGYLHNDVWLGKSTTSYTGRLFTGSWNNPSAHIGGKWGTEEIRPRNISLLACIKT